MKRWCVNILAVLAFVYSLEAKKKPTVSDPVGDSCDPKVYESKRDPNHPKYILACVYSRIVRLSDKPPTPVSSQVSLQDLAPVKSRCGPTTADESPQHVFERKRCESLEGSMNSYEQSRRFDSAINSHQLIESNSARQVKDRLYKYYIEDMESWALSIKRLGYVEECAKVYKDSSELKQSDLTVRQVEAIGACKNLGLFPPRT